MAQKIKANSGYNLERLGDRALITFTPEKITGWDALVIRLLFLPILILALVIWSWIYTSQSEMALGFYVAVGIVTAYFVAKHFILKKIKYDPTRKAHRITITRDELHCYFGVYDRQDIRSIQYVSPDTRFTSTGNLSHALKTDKAAKKLRTEYTVAAEYGAEVVTVSGRILSERQSEAIAGILQTWLQNPDLVIQGEQPKAS